MNIGIENDWHFATHLYQTSSKSSMQSRLRIQETLKIPCFLKTTELNIVAFNTTPKIGVDHLHQFNNGLSNRKRPFCIENGILTRLTAVTPDPLKLLKQTKYVGLQVNMFSMSSVVSVGKTSLKH